ncbi:MAG: low-complexity tail membrane protein [Cyanobium sp.]
MPARSEPLLWVQLIGGGALPLEALLLLLVLAGGDPGPVPALERLLCWALGGVVPALVLWHRPADVWSLLLLQTPLRARRPLQQKLSRLQDNPGLRIALAIGSALTLPLLWWLDEHAAIATPISPLAETPRLVELLLASALLAVMVWQWQQLLQAFWLLSRTDQDLEAVRPLSLSELEEQRLSLGLPLLLLDPLSNGAPPPAGSSPGARPRAATTDARANAAIDAAAEPQTDAAADAASPAPLAEPPEAET